MKQGKKLFLTLLIILSVNMGLFARTTVVHSSYYNNGPNLLFNDIYSSLMISSIYTNPVTTAETDNVVKVGANYNSSVFFKDFPVGGYSSFDVSQLESDVYMLDGILGLAFRQSVSPVQETYLNFGPAVSIITQDEDSSLTPYTLVYWGAGINAGYRIAASPQVKALAIDVGASAKAFWYDGAISVNTLGVGARDFRYSISGYVGITYRWFAPNWSDEDLNVIIAL